MLTKYNGLSQSKFRYVSAFLLIAGPAVFMAGALSFGYNKISGIRIAQSEWSRYKKERNSYLDAEKARLNADMYKEALEQNKLQEATKYFAEMPAVMNSLNGMTLVNFGKVINGETAQYSYKLTIGQQTYNVQGGIRIQGNDMIYEDDYSKTSPEVMSSGEVRHEKNAQDGTFVLQLITTKNSGNLSKLGDVRLFTFSLK